MDKLVQTLDASLREERANQAGLAGIAHISVVFALGHKPTPMEKDILGPLFRPGPVRDQTLNPKRVLDFQNKRQKDLAGGKEISTWLKEDNDKVQSALARGRERLKVAEQSKSKPKWMVEDDNNNDRKCLEVLRKMVYQAVLWRTWYSA